MKIYGIGVYHLIIGVRAYGLHLNHNTTRVRATTPRVYAAFSMNHNITRVRASAAR